MGTGIFLKWRRVQFCDINTLLCVLSAGAVSAMSVKEMEGPLKPRKTEHWTRSNVHGTMNI